MKLAGQRCPEGIDLRDEKTRRLGAQLLLSEVLEYVIRGLGVTPEIGGVRILNPEDVVYHAERQPDTEEMLDGLADVAYTMYWNQGAFGLPLEEAFELVCDNNLEKFVLLKHWTEGERELDRTQWDCGCDVGWPSEVHAVTVMKVGDDYYAIGKDKNGKVRKPSTYQGVDLSPLLAKSVA